MLGQKSIVVKWDFADIGLSTAPLTAPCKGQECAARWVTRLPSAPPVPARADVRGKRIWRDAVKRSVWPAAVIEANVMALSPQHVAQHPAAAERMLQMQLADPAASAPGLLRWSLVS